MYCKLSSSDVHMFVDFNGDHNHQTDTPAALSKRDVAPETRTKLLDLFASGSICLQVATRPGAQDGYSC